MLEVLCQLAYMDAENSRPRQIRQLQAASLWMYLLRDGAALQECSQRWQSTTSLNYW